MFNIGLFVNFIQLVWILKQCEEVGKTGELIHFVYLTVEIFLYVCHVNIPCLVYTTFKKQDFKVNSLTRLVCLSFFIPPTFYQYGWWWYKTFVPVQIGFIHYT